MSDKFTIFEAMNSKKIAVSIVLIILAMLMNTVVQAQCAMCRATMENNVSDGGEALAASLNYGVLYLFAAPYLIVGSIFGLWYYNAKKNADK